MILYSKTIISFLKKIELRSRLLITQEMGLLFHRNRFSYNGHHYPLHFVIFEDPNKLGQFDPSSYQIALNKKLMYLAKDEVIDNILRHELAHMYHYIAFGMKHAAHGKEYRSICEKFGWGESVFSAYANIDQENQLVSNDTEFEKIKEKIKKLMALANSSNTHEAELATLKANEYLFKYNIKLLNTNSFLDSDEEEVCVDDIYTCKRSDAYINAFYPIAEHFYVRVVISRKSGETALTAVGSRVNIEMAKYILDTLKIEFERLWEISKKMNPNWKGLAYKNNYIKGLSIGLTDKLKKEKTNIQNTGHGKELVAIEKKLSQQFDMAFPRTRASKSSAGQIFTDALTKGSIDGGKINIRKGINNQKGETYLLT